MRALLLYLVFAGFASLPLSSAAAGDRPRSVDVNQATILMGDLIPGLRPDVAKLEFGPAPNPGMSRTLSASEIRMRLVYAGIDTARLHLPSYVRVRRDAQTVNSAALEELIRDTLQGIIPQEYKLRSVSVRGGIVTAPGKLSLSLAQQPAWRAGRLLATFTMHVDGVPSRELLSSVELERLSRRETAAVTRGQAVTIIAALGAVSIRARGVAQEPGHVGDTVGLLVQDGHRIIKGVVRSADLVEVLP